MKTPPDDTATTLDDLKALVRVFRDERGWKKHHTPKNLSMSIAIEAAELMEHFQYDGYSDTDKQAVADELADVLINCLNFADIMDIDIATAYRDKLRRAGIKFPTDIFHPGAADNGAEYRAIRRAYRSGKPKG